MKYAIWLNVVRERCPDRFVLAQAVRPIGNVVPTVCV